jgi:hypothetical protein
MGQITNGRFVSIHAAADFLGPGAIEINRYQTEIYDMIKRRFPFGQRIDHTPATGQPSRYFEQVAIPSATFVDPRILQATATQPSRQERVVTLKALTAQVNFGIFDVEVNQQQGQFAYLEAKDLTDTVDSVLKQHDQSLWTGNDTDLLVTTSFQYYGVSGQIINATQVGVIPQTFTVSSTGSLVNGIKTQVANMASRTDFEVRPSACYSNPLGLDLLDQEAKAFQLYFNKAEILPGVIVEAIPTQMGLLPLISDPALSYAGTVGAVGSRTFSYFILSEDSVQYHWLTNPLPRVFQLGLLQNLAAQYVVVKFGAPVVKGAAYAHSVIFAPNR